MTIVLFLSSGWAYRDQLAPYWRLRFGWSGYYRGGGDYGDDEHQRSGGSPRAVFVVGFAFGPVFPTAVGLTFQHFSPSGWEPPSG